ncbi:MAG: LD-carboxypeptidase [Bacteroidia bacterium]|nr:LD-carboxypeptidase [Bacteroidia bacterium]
MRWPAPLRPGDSIVLVAPSRQVYPADIRPFMEFTENQGWKVRYEAGLFAREGALAGTAAHRLVQLQAALDNPEVRAIWFVRGGHGVSHLWRRLSWEGLQRYPKWLIGFSDITPLLWGAARAGIVAIHGPVAAHIPHRVSPKALELLLQLLQSEELDCTLTWQRRPWDAWRVGTAFGPLLGGNLSLLQTLCGTPLDLKEWESRPILFWEETSEYYYKLDRMSWHLHNAGWYHKAAALVIGGLTAMSDDEEEEYSLSPQQIASDSTGSLAPIASGFPVGHQETNFPIPIGAWAHLLIQESVGKLRFWRKE